MLNLKTFLKAHEIEFDSDEKAVRWIRSMKPEALARIGSSYFVDEDEATRLLEKYLQKQTKLRKKRALQAKKNFHYQQSNSLFGKLTASAAEYKSEDKS